MRGLLATTAVLIAVLQAAPVHAEDPDVPPADTAASTEPAGPTPDAPPGPAAAPATPGGPSPTASSSKDSDSPSIDPLAWLDPKKWAADILDALLTAIGEALIGAIRGFIDWATGLGGSSLNFITRTPPEGTYASPTVRNLWEFFRGLANVLLAVIVLWGGFGIVLKEQTRSPYPELLELLPRLVLAALAANLTLDFARFLIDVNNGIAEAVGQTELPGYDHASPTQQGIAGVLSALAYGIVALLLVFQMLIRLALIDVLIVLAPIAALLWVLPQTQTWTRWWGELFPTTVFQQAIQMMALRLGAALMVELTPGSVENAVLTLLLGIAVCYLTLKIPSLLRSRGSQASVWNLVTLAVAARATGALGGGGGRGAAARISPSQAPAGRRAA